MAEPGKARPTCGRVSFFAIFSALFFTWKRLLSRLCNAPSTLHVIFDKQPQSMLHVEVVQKPMGCFNVLWKTSTMCYLFPTGKPDAPWLCSKITWERKIVFLLTVARYSFSRRRRSLSVIECNDKNFRDTVSRKISLLYLPDRQRQIW